MTKLLLIDDEIKKPTSKGVGFLNQICFYLFTKLTDNTSLQSTLAKQIILGFRPVRSEA